ncbi:MAG: M1 family metallopeptidase [Clostridiales bacterium]|jgi:hypothetical protein|nr:M1 family metallopeptidase [Clostridiales bacterium]
MKLPLLHFILCLAALLTACSPKTQSSSSTAPVQVITVSALPESLTPIPTPAPPVYNDYTINLDINPSERTVTGVEKIKYRNRADQTLATIYFNVYLNAFTEENAKQSILPADEEKVYPSGYDYGEMMIDSVAVDNEDARFALTGTVLRVDLPEPLEPDDDAEIKLQLRAVIPKINARTGANNFALWCGNFLPALAVYDSQGWHTSPYYPVGNPFYTRSANYTVSISAPFTFTVVGSGEPVVQEQSGRKSTVFTAKMERDFAFALSDCFQHETFATTAGVDIDLYTFTDFSGKSDLLALAADALEYFSGKISPYPYSHLTIVETGLPYAGGMAYPEIIFMDSACLQEANAFQALTYEIGRQWFYGVIGSNDVENAWMSEGLIRFFQERFARPPENLRAIMGQEYADLQVTLRSMNLRGLDQDLSAYRSRRDYESTQCARGKLMFYALFAKMGEDRFDGFITEYYRKYSFRTAEPADLIRIASETLEEDLTDFFHQWITASDLPSLDS